jgi:hypothetical protein
MPISCADTAFSASRDRFEQVCSFLGDQEAASLTHSELEQRLTVDLRELVRQLYQDHLDLRAVREQRLDDVVDAEGSRRASVESGHVRPLQTIFGAVEVTRLAYRRRGERNLCPADAALNLPRELHSHGLRELSAIESSRGSFEEASEAIRRITGGQLGKRQVEQLAARAAVDFEAFYSQPTRSQATVTEGALLVLSADGKGIVMRPDALRPATAKGSKAGHRQAADPTVQGRETQPETDGRGRCRLRPHTTGPNPQRHHRARRRHGPASGTQGEQQVAHRERGRQRGDGHLFDLRGGPTP